MSELRIPKSWARVRLQEVCQTITDGTHQTPTYVNSGTVFLSSKNVTAREIDWENVKYIPEKLHRELSKRISPRKNDILLAKNGTTGVAAIVDRDLVFDIYVSLALLRPLDLIMPEYLLWAINSPRSKRQFNKRLKGVGVPNLHLKEIRDVEIGLPPVAEQRRIVAKIGWTQEKIKMIESTISSAEVLIDKYRESILQKAFRGELIPQDSNDEPASKLIERIRALSTKQSGNKKSGELPLLRSEETKFEIPKSWAWMRISELGTWGGGITPSKANSSYWNRGTVAWTSPKDMKTDLITSSEDQITRTALDECNINLYPVGSVLIVTRSGILRHTLPVAVLGIESTVNQDIKALIPHKEINSDFVFFYLKAFERDLLRICGKKGATVESIDFDKFLSTPVPVPPKAEQVRLVDALKKSLSSIASLASNVVNVREVHKALFTAILENAFQGSLVPQIDSEGTGHDLVTSMQTAKSEADDRSNPKKLKKRRK